MKKIFIDPEHIGNHQETFFERIKRFLDFFENILIIILGIIFYIPIAIISIFLVFCLVLIGIIVFFASQLILWVRS